MTKKVLFLFPYPPGESPSQRFRFEQYLELLKIHGFTIHTSSFWDLKTWKVLYSPGKITQKLAGFFGGLFRRVGILWRLQNFDFIFVHRECLPIGPPLMEWIISKIYGKKIVYDFDDAIWLDSSSSWLVNFLRWNSKVERICRWSFRVSCGNEYLAGFARQFNPIGTVVNPTTIDTRYHYRLPERSENRGDVLTLGWTGSHSTLPYLDSLNQVFAILEEKLGAQWRLLVIADQKPNLSSKALEFRNWSKQSEIKDLLEFDIGLMPLPDDPWAQGKCGFKILQYFALEIPAVVSPVGINRTIVEHEVNGYHCNSTEEWVHFICKLAADKNLRQSFGAKGREKVVREYSIESNGENFVRLFL